MSEIVAAVVGAVIGVLGSYVLDIRQTERRRLQSEDDAERERRRGRATVATALLQDCRRLEFQLRGVFGQPRATQLALARQSLFYDSPQRDVRWFAPESIQPVT